MPIYKITPPKISLKRAINIISETLEASAEGEPMSISTFVEGNLKHRMYSMVKRKIK